jgi:hypothetical protein
MDKHLFVNPYLEGKALVEGSGGKLQPSCRLNDTQMQEALTL